MGRLIEIDVDKLKELLNENKIELTNNIISIVRDNYIPKADYEKRLKADMVAMLTEIREKAWYHHSKFDDERDFEVDKAVEDIVNHIDAKINSLKEVKDANTKEK